MLKQENIGNFCIPTSLSLATFASTGFSPLIFVSFFKIYVQAVLQSL